MFLKSFEDTTLIVLIVAAVVSLAVGKHSSPRYYCNSIFAAPFISANVAVERVTHPQKDERTE
jgi:magnesium-transporting ATPase (P-type)